VLNHYATGREYAAHEQPPMAACRILFGANQGDNRLPQALLKAR
jgi:hypothetical protein